MPMNIKNEETCRLAHQLAQATGESLTAAITTAVQERLARLEQSHHSLTEQLLALGKDCASRMKEPYLTLPHGDLLYDTKGLPA
jgi:antitoxin VapB